jgi:hypothetical protein
MGPQSGLDHTPRLQVGQTAFGLPATCHLGELGADEARRDRSDGHARAAQFLGERLREAEHERLARRIGGEVRHGLERHLRGDIDDATPTPDEHLWEERAGQRDDRLDVEAQRAGSPPWMRHR